MKEEELLSRNKDLVASFRHERGDDEPEEDKAHFFVESFCLRNAKVSCFGARKAKENANTASPCLLTRLDHCRTGRLRDADGRAKTQPDLCHPARVSVGPHELLVEVLRPFLAF